MWLVYTLLAVLCFSLVNVLDSFLVRRYVKDPVILMWSQSMLGIVIFAFMAVLFDVSTSWWFILLLSGVLAYAGDILFFTIIERIDISLINVAWAILTIFLSIGGFVLFDERWTLLQSLGAICVLTGVLVLSAFHAYISLGRTLLLFVALAGVYFPFYLLQKAAMLEDVPARAVLFWSLLLREGFAACIPFLIPAWRKRALALLPRLSAGYVVTCVIVIAMFYLGSLSIIHAYASGYISHVSVTANVQPFIVILLSWVLLHFTPSLAPRETLTRQSLAVKISSFLLVFAGLALLALHQ